MIPAEIEALRREAVKVLEASGYEVEFIARFCPEPEPEPDADADAAGSP